MDEITSIDTVLLHSLTGDWSHVNGDEPGIAISIRKLAAAGLAVFEDDDAMRTPKGDKFMKSTRQQWLAECALGSFADGIREAAEGAHIPTDAELASGVPLKDPAIRGRDKSRNGSASISAGLVYGNEHGLAADYEPTVADYYKGRHLTNYRTVTARIEAAA